VTTGTLVSTAGHEIVAFDATAMYEPLVSVVMTEFDALSVHCGATQNVVPLTLLALIVAL
jgi:hypothetical protein